MVKEILNMLSKSSCKGELGIICNVKLIVTLCEYIYIYSQRVTISFTLQIIPNSPLHELLESIFSISLTITLTYYTILEMMYACLIMNFKKIISHTKQIQKCVLFYRSTFFRLLNCNVPKEKSSFTTLFT